MSPLDQPAWVLAFDARSAHLLVVSCVDNPDTAPDAKCAIAAARQAFGNIA